MRQNHPCTLSHLVSESRFARLKQQSSQLSELERLLQSVLEQHKLKQSKIANFRKGTLILAVPSSAWLTRFNFSRSQILSDLRKNIPGLVSIEAKINPELAKTTPAQEKVTPAFTPNPRRISGVAASHILELAEHAPPELKEKLERLAALATERKASTDSSD